MKTYTLVLLAVLLLSCQSPSVKNNVLKELNTHIIPRVLYYEGNQISSSTNFKFKNNQSFIKKQHAEWSCIEAKSVSKDNHLNISYDFQLTNGVAKDAGVSVNFSFKNWDPDNYIIMPAAAYRGNKFEVRKYSYPPFFKKGEYDANKPITITDIPRLNKHSGDSKMELTTGDLSTPAVGVYFPEINKGLWILTEQTSRFGNYGLTFKENKNRTEAEFSISAPCVREKWYRFGAIRLTNSEETGAAWKEGDKVSIKCKVFVFDDIQSPAELNAQFLAIRKLAGHSGRVDQLPFSKAFGIMEENENRENWDKNLGYYTLGGNGWNTNWQLGWVGGCIVTHPLALIGSTVSQKRAFTNYNTIITKTQAQSGFYYSCGNGKGWCSDCFSKPFPDNLLLLRKNADALYYFHKYILAQKTIDPEWKIPEEWKEPLQKLANAFTTLWKRYGQFGQFIDMETGGIKIGKTNSAAMAIGGLALTWQLDKNPEYLQIAKEAARYYYREFINRGLTCGGPSEILQNNDSESSFATLESFVTLYEVTGEKEWLEYAEDAAALSATWVVSYDYQFPPSSLFGRLDMKTTGAVWASTQNKHAAPGICTLSGDCLFKLYRFTGNDLYLNLIGDIAHNIMQYISRTDRPIASQHPGWVNERVNMSDWEGKDKVGEIFKGNTWAEVSAMLTVAEIPGIYVDLTKNKLFVFDHVKVTLKGNRLYITNPTKFDAEVRIFVDKNPSKPYPQGFISTCPRVLIRAGETKTYNIHR